MTNEKKIKTVYRVPPCPAYDIEGMQNWLSTLAAEGFILKEDGFFCGVAAFERTTPRALTYRLDVVPSRNLFDDPNDIPCEDVQETYAAFGWHYVATRKPFYIYCTEEYAPRELNTDPQVQALALRTVMKQAPYPAVSLFFWAIVFPLLFRRIGLLSQMVALGTPLCAVGLLLLLLYLLSALYDAVHLHRAYRRLRAQQPLHQKNVDPFKRQWYAVTKAIMTIVTVVWVIVFSGSTLLRVTNENEQPISEYNGTPPFATIADFAPQGTYRQEKLSFTNHYQLRSDLLAPVMIEWNENADVIFSDGTVLSGGLMIDYFETVSPAVARILAWEMHRTETRDKNYAVLELPDLGVDYAVAYTETLHAPAIILQDGCKVMCVLFYQTSANYEMPLEEWAVVVADHLRDVA